MDPARCCTSAALDCFSTSTGTTPVVSVVVGRFLDGTVKSGALKRYSRLAKPSIPTNPLTPAKTKSTPPRSKTKGNLAYPYHRLHERTRTFLLAEETTNAISMANAGCVSSCSCFFSSSVCDQFTCWTVEGEHGRRLFDAVCSCHASHVVSLEWVQVSVPGSPSLCCVMGQCPHTRQVVDTTQVTRAGRRRCLGGHRL